MWVWLLVCLVCLGCVFVPMGIGTCCVLGYYSLVSFAVYGFGLLIDVCVCLFNSYGLLCCICLLIVFGFWVDMIWWLWVIVFLVGCCV